MFSLSQLLSGPRHPAFAPHGADIAAPPRSSSLADVCKLLNIVADLEGQRPGLRFAHARVRTGEKLYQGGQACEQLYVLKSGFLKTIMLDGHGNEQVVGFPMRAALLGIDGIDSGFHQAEVVALTDSDLIILPRQELMLLGRTCPGLSRGMYGAMSAELSRELPVITRRGLTTIARVGRFLLDMSERFGAMGYSRSEFNLPMMRLDIASYLGIAQETVSRALVSLEARGLITLHQRTVRICDHDGLRALKRAPRLRYELN